MKRFAGTIMILCGLLVVTALLIGCGNSSEEAEKTTEKEEVHQQESTQSHGYPTTAVAVVKMFYWETAEGNLASAIAKYVEDGEQIVEDLKNTGRLEQLAQITSSFNYEITNDEKMDDDQVSVTVQIHSGEGVEDADHTVRLVDGKWVLDNGFIK